MIICNRCGKENQDHYKFCLGCGAELSNAAPKPAPSGGDVGMMKTVMADVGPSITPPGGVNSGGLPGMPGPGGPSSQGFQAPRPSGPYNTPKGPPLGAGPPPGVPGPDQRRPGPGMGPGGRGPGPGPGSGQLTPRPQPTTPSPWNPNDQSGPVAAPISGHGPAAGPGYGGRAGGTPGPQPVGGPRTCGSCGAVVPAAFKFCGVCGSKMEAAPPADTIRKPAARARLTLIRPDGTEGGTHQLSDGENTIGRNHGEVFENDGYLSPTHALLVVNGNRAVIRDLGSLNGVFVKMTQEEGLRPGQVIRIGQELLRFDTIDPPEPLPDGTEVMGSPNPGYWGKITVIIGNGVDGSAYPLLGDTVTLGRERGEINFPDDGYVSGLHARLSHRDGKVFLTDLNSSNGTFIKVQTERQLVDDSFILLGQQLFRVNLG